MRRQFALIASLLVISALVPAATQAVTYDWHPLNDKRGGYEYIVQVEPELVAAAQAGQLEAIESNVPQYLGPIRRIRVVLGGNQSAKVLADRAASKPVTLTSRQNRTAAAKGQQRHKVAKPVRKPTGKNGERSVLKHTVRQPITGGQASQGFTPSTQLQELEQGFQRATNQIGEAGNSVAQGFQNGLQQGENALRTAQQTLGQQPEQSPRTTIGGELLNGAQNLRQRTRERLGQAGDAIEGTAENLRDGTRNLLNAPRQLLEGQQYPQPAAAGSGQFKQFSYLTNPAGNAEAGAGTNGGVGLQNNAAQTTGAQSPYATSGQLNTNNSPAWLTQQNNTPTQQNTAQQSTAQQNGTPSPWQRDSRGFVTGDNGTGNNGAGTPGTDWNGPALEQDNTNQTNGGTGYDYRNQQQKDPWVNNNPPNNSQPDYNNQQSPQYGNPQYGNQSGFVRNDGRQNNTGQYDEQAYVPLLGNQGDRRNAPTGMVPVSVGTEQNDQQGSYNQWNNNPPTGNQTPYANNGGMGNFGNQGANNQWGDNPGTGQSTNTDYYTGNAQQNLWGANTGNNQSPPLAGDPAMQNPGTGAGNLPPMNNPSQQGQVFNTGNNAQQPDPQYPTDPRRSFNHTVLASLACIGSLFGNFFLGMSYLDVRNKYQTALRRTVRTFSRSGADD